MSRRRIVIWVEQGSKRKIVSKKRKKKECEKKGLNSCYDTLLDVLHSVGGSGPY